MSDWKCYQLKNLGVIKTGKTPPSSCKDAFSNTGVPFVTPKDMNGVKTIFKTERYLSKIGLDSVKNYLVPKNSIAVSCIGSDMGKAYLLSEDSVTNQQINTLIVNNNHNFEFIYYKLSIMQDYLKSIAGGSATPILNKSHFSEIEIELPDLDTQNNFVEKLKYLDKKIQLNTQINKTLEQIAQALFKSWFVDFDPVRAKVQALSDGLSLEQAELAAMQAISGKTPEELTALSQTQPERYAELAETAKAFPCEMVEVDGVEVPKGWKYCSFGDVSECFDSKRIPLSKQQREKRKGNIPYYGATSVMDYVDEAIFDDIYLLVGEDGSVLKEDRTPFTQYIWGKSWVNNHAHVLKGKNGISTEHLMIFIQQTNISAYITGAVQLKLNQKNMNSIPFLKANNEINVFFAEYIESLYAKIRENLDENKILETARDLLLPKLLNGDI